MRILCFSLLLLILCPESFAQASRHYEFHESDLLPFSSYEALIFNGKLKSHDLTGYPALNFRKMGLPFDQLFHSASMRKMLAVKFNLTPIGMKEDEIIEVEGENLLVTHIRINKTWALIVAQGFEIEELKKIIAPQGSSFSFLKFLIPSAHASDCTEIHNVAAPLHQLSQEMEQQSLSSRIAQCMSTAATSLKESLKESLDFYGRIASSPLQVWREFKQGMSAFGQVIYNLRQEISGITSSLGHLSPSLMGEVVCGFTGIVISKLATSLILGPASLARSIPEITLKIKTAADKLTSLNALANKIPSLQAQGLTRELLQCAL